MNLSNFGQQFAEKVVRRTFQKAVVDAIANRDYEGEIKKPGDRVNLLSFLNAAEINDYAVGTDMVVGQIIDANDQLIVEKRKYYNFALDRLEELFTYAGDIPDAVIELHSQKLAAIVDAYVLDKAASEVKAGSWLGVNLLVTGAAATMASLVTSATGGTITVVFDSTNINAATGGATFENSLDGNTYFGGFESGDLYKGIRLVSTRSIVSPWWRITAITNTVSVAVTEWDSAVSGPDFAENYTLRGIFGGDGTTFPKYTDANGNDVSAWVAGNGGSGFGWEIQAAIATSMSATTIYKQVTILNQFLDENEIPADGRRFVLPPSGITALRQASELQPTGYGELYAATVLNGKVGRVGSFDVYEAAGARVSFRSGHSTAAGVGADTVATAGARGYVMPACDMGFITYADKWTESRVVDQINQFAKNYQGLFLFGAKVPAIRRNHAAALFASV